jgi:hypothetical protein
MLKMKFLPVYKMTAHCHITFSLHFVHMYYYYYYYIVIIITVQ